MKTYAYSTECYEQGGLKELNFKRKRIGMTVGRGNKNCNFDKRLAEVKNFRN